ncbi:hypothetical protein GC173_04055 [bacterium]|nr:hypothetical protein [bacterium]
MIQTRNRRAIVLVLILWIIVVLSLIAYSLLFQTSTETTMTSQRRRQFRAETLARSGVAKAIVDLRNDLIFDTAEEAKTFDAEGDVWARPEEGKLNSYPDDRFEGNEETGFFNTYVYDESGYFNVNRFSPQNMIILQKIIEHIGYEEEDAKIVAASIVDWKDFDEVPALPSAPSNEEGIAYAVLKGEDEDGPTDVDEVEPLVLRNENYLSVDELLEVYGVTPDLYFGPGTPEAEYYNALIPPPQGDRFKIEPKRRSRDEPVYGLRDYLTVLNSSTLNINTAPVQVLAALAEGAGNTTGDSWAESVVKNRRGNRDDDIDNDNAIKDMTELQANGEVAGVVSIAQNLYPVTVSSSFFRIVSIGEYQGAKVRIEAIVNRELEQLTRNESFEATDRAEDRLERNSARTERRTDKNNELIVRYPAVRIIQMRID